MDKEFVLFRLQTERQLNHWQTAAQTIRRPELVASSQAWAALEHYVGASIRQSLAAASDQLIRDFGVVRAQFVAARSLADLDAVSAGIALASFTVLWKDQLGSGSPAKSQAAAAKTRKLMLTYAQLLTNPDAALLQMLEILVEAMGIVLKTIDLGSANLLGGSKRRATDQLVQQREDFAKLRIHSVALNRDANHAVWRSRKTVKADAAQRLFKIDTTGIQWAVVDSGIDAWHAAFGGSEMKVIDSARIVESYDFTYARELLATARLPVIAPDLPATIRENLDGILQGEDLADLPA